MDETKVFSVVFSRGSGTCAEEVTYVLLDTDIENVKQRVQNYYKKYFSKGNWHVGIFYDDTFAKDSDGFYYVSGYFS